MVHFRYALHHQSCPETLNPDTSYVQTLNSAKEHMRCQFPFGVGLTAPIEFKLRAGVSGRCRFPCFGVNCRAYKLGFRV